MSFKNVFNALYTQVKAYGDLSYVDQTQFFKGRKEVIPQQKYILIFEPGTHQHDADGKRSSTSRIAEYSIEIWGRILLMRKGVEGGIIGYGSDKGALDFIDDIIAAIESDLTFGYTRGGSSVSAANDGTSFELTSSTKSLTVLMNGITRSGYTTISCGETTLTGVQVAANIQTSLRALGLYGDDGYTDAICTFDNDTKKFTITSALKGPGSTVAVAPGASNDCSALLGFDSPTEVGGRNIVKVNLGSVDANNEIFPVRYRILPVTITEEISV